MLRFLILAFCIGISHSLFSQTRILATRVDHAIKPDGRLDEKEWQEAVEYTSFMQARPTPGKEPSEKTSIRILYDNTSLYIGITAYSTDPSRILANNLVRDKWNSNDDGISFILDTYNDKANALLFFTNPLGARMDEEVIGNEGGLNGSWDTFWDVAVDRNEKGYSVEYSIPFSSLRFQSKDTVVMAFRVIRQIAAKNEYAIFPASDINVPNMIWRVSTSTEIVFTGLKAKKPVYLSPYVNFNYTGANTYDALQNKYSGSKEFLHRNYFSNTAALDKIASNIGADLKFGLSKNNTLDLTANTDFAQAEVDSRVFNITRFSINLPEKRAFFLESANYLGYALPTGEVLFNSRNIGIVNGKIVPILGGVRLTGKAGKLQLGVLNMQTKGIASESIDGENFSVFRFRRTIQNNGSFFGGIITNRVTTSSRKTSNQVVGLDYYKRVGDHWSYGFNLAGSKDLDQNVGIDNIVYNGFLSKNADKGLEHWFSYTSSGKNFNPASGFIYDRGFKEINMANSYAWYLTRSKKANSFGLILFDDAKWRAGDKTYYESGYHALEGRLRYKNGLSFFLKYTINSDSLPFNWNFAPEIIIPVKNYRMSSVWTHIESPSTKTLTWLLEAEYGNFYDGNKWQVNPNLNWNMNKHFRFALNYYWIHIDFPGEFASAASSDYSSHLVRASFSYSYSIRLSLRALVQYDNLSKTIGTNARIRYNPKEGTDLYIVYSPMYNTAIERLDPHLPLMNNQSFIVKFVKTINLSK